MSMEDLFKVFEWGIDYGLLLAEQERDSEDMFVPAVGPLSGLQRKSTWFVGIVMFPLKNSDWGG